MSPKAPTDDLLAAFDAEAFRSEGHRLVDQLADYLSGALAKRSSDGALLPVLAPVLPEEMLARWDGVFPEGPSGGSLGALVGRVIDGSNHLHHPHYLGHQVTAPLPLAALCDLAAALLNNGMAVYEMGMAATAMERRVLAWMAGELGFDASADGVLTSGGSAGNLTALLAARQAHAGFDAWSEGTAGTRLAVLAAEQAHYSVARALQVMGLGAEALVPVPVDDGLRLRAEALPDALSRARAAGRRVFAVVANAGSTATGSFDPLEPIADFCAREGLWLHVDGAHGAAAVLAPETRGLVAGISRADSVVWDAHKMMLMPALVSAVLFREGRRSYEAFAQEASYLFRADASERGEWWNVGLRTLECTKRMLSLKLYASLSLLGTRLFADYVARCFALGRRFGEMLEAAPDFELALPPECNIVCFRHRPETLAGASTSALDAHQQRLRARVLESGDFYLVQTRLPPPREGTWLRTTLLHPTSGEAELEALLSRLREAAAP
ncbi:MAG TPA: aminotransferase class I/II-fold pyridoxal phosphate-dependent enzyme [Myxococcota bacterium]|nr:aminotransferase class I/II-fold pyridoxal phosphate-dependent enzyme [Myxococcota bacterium]